MIVLPPQISQNDSHLNREGRDYSLDIIRVIACLMVVLMHSPSKETGLDGVSYHVIDMISQPCIGLFFMVSGALLLPTKLPYFEFVKRRIAKIIRPTLIFSILTLILAWGFGEINGQFLIKNILSIPFATYRAGVLWFMYPLIGMYLMAPIVSPFLEKATKKGNIGYIGILVNHIMLETSSTCTKRRYLTREYVSCIQWLYWVFHIGLLFEKIPN